MDRLNKSDYRMYAECGKYDPETFYPLPGSIGHQQTREAKAICAVCPVAYFCLKDALDNKDNFGIWGGTTERERKYLERNKGKLAIYLYELESRLEELSA